MYLYLALSKMFQMSWLVKEAMLTFINLFKHYGVAQYTGENIILIPEELLGVGKWMLFKPFRRST